MRDPELYDAALSIRGRTWDVPFYVELARRVDGPVLEIGTGTGRVLTALLAAGVDAYGVEIDPAMARATRTNLEARFGADAGHRVRRGSVVDPLSGGPFRLVLAPYNVLCALLSGDELAAMLRSVHRATGASGQLAFDVILGELRPWTRPPIAGCRRPAPSPAGSSSTRAASMTPTPGCTRSVRSFADRTAT